MNEAIANLNDAIKADPKQPTAYDQLGTILVEQGRLEEAASNYRLLVGIRKLFLSDSVPIFSAARATRCALTSG